MIWRGIDVSVWGPIQTLIKRRPKMKMSYYTGYEILSSWDGLVEDIPLNVRYEDFTERLSAVLRNRTA